MMMQRALVTLVVAFFLTIAFQTYQLIREHSNLEKAHAGQQAPLEQALQMRQETEGLAGDVADFAGAAEKPPLRAAVLDALANASPPRGIRLKNARIDGALDLGDVSLGALALDDCDIAAPLVLDGARLGRLSIIGSRHAGLRARGATIDGQVDFAGAKPLAQQS